MLNSKKIAVVMPAYNAARTLEKTFEEIPKDIVDVVILVDDCSKDGTVQLSKDLGILTHRHEVNLGYGGNQKTCYRLALDQGADIVVMLHPDYQYTPKLIRSMVGAIAEGVYDTMLASRILGKGALMGGMPLYKYISNRFLTFAENLLIDQKLSEYHTGYRAFSRDVLESLDLSKNSNDFIFDNQMLVQIHAQGWKIGELSCPTKYFPEASSINFRRSLRYGILCLLTGAEYALHRWGIRKSNRYNPLKPLKGAV